MVQHYILLLIHVIFVRIKLPKLALKRLFTPSPILCKNHKRYFVKTMLNKLLLRELLLKGFLDYTEVK